MLCGGPEGEQGVGIPSTVLTAGEPLVGQTYSLLGLQLSAAVPVVYEEANGG